MANPNAMKSSRKNLEQPTSDVAEDLWNVTDIKQFFYCPRILYFDKVLHLPQKTKSQQAESKTKHVEMNTKEARRKGAIFYDKELDEAEKFFQVPLASEKLALKGVLDCLIKTTKEYIPIDYKYQASDHKRVHLHHKYQLVAYAALVEEHFNTNVRRGYVYYVPEQLKAKVEITPEIKRFMLTSLQRMKKLVDSQLIPPVASCPAACGYEWICDAYPIFHQKKS